MNYYEFEATVDYILNNKEVADAMGKNGHDYVMKHFSWDIIVDKYVRFLGAIG